MTSENPNDILSFRTDQIIPLDQTASINLRLRPMGNDELNELSLKLKPFLEGIDVYKKSFDTHFITNVKTQVRFNPLNENKRISPMNEGYSMRRATLANDDLKILQFRN